MNERELDVKDIAQQAPTGEAPSDARIDELRAEAHRRASAHHEGQVADHIAILARALAGVSAFLIGGTLATLVGWRQVFVVVLMEAALNFTIPLYIQIVQGRTPFDTSSAMLPFNLTVFFLPRSSLRSTSTR